jgi:hypothetical protein
MVVLERAVDAEDGDMTDDARATWSPNRHGRGTSSPRPGWGTASSGDRREAVKMRVGAVKNA